MAISPILRTVLVGDISASEGARFRSIAIHKQFGHYAFCAVFALSSCGGAAGDLIWHQKATVHVDAIDFERCVAAAAGDVPGVSLDRSLSTSGSIALTVKLEQELPRLGVLVQRRLDDTAEVIFWGKGAREPDAVRGAITPLIDAIARAMERHCPSKPS
jgi:hypothetical protein